MTREEAIAIIKENKELGEAQAKDFGDYAWEQAKPFWDAVEVLIQTCEQVGKIPSVGKLEQIIGEAVGEASTLWINDKGEFDSTRGIAITRRTVEAVISLFSHPFPEQKVREVLERLYYDKVDYKSNVTIEIVLKQIMDLVR